MVLYETQMTGRRCKIHVCKYVHAAVRDYPLESWIYHALLFIYRWQQLY